MEDVIEIYFGNVIVDLLIVNHALFISIGTLVYIDVTMCMFYNYLRRHRKICTSTWAETGFWNR